MKLSFAPTAVAVTMAVAGCASVQSGAGGSPPIVAEGFEGTAVGEIPAGYAKQGAVGVASDQAHSGRQSLKIEPAVRGGRGLNFSPEMVAALGGEHWGRMYVKFKTPAPLPAAGTVPGDGRIIHATLVHGGAVSPTAGDNIDVRLATFTEDTAGDVKWFYNVQPRGGRREFSRTSTVTRKFTDAWTLLEWHVDNATQTYEFFIDGVRTDFSGTQGPGNYTNLEIPPAFQTYSIGFTNYQTASGDGFTVWIDDLAIGKQRLGPVRGG